MTFTSTKHIWCNTINNLDCISTSLSTPSFLWKNESNFMKEEQLASIQDTNFGDEVQGNRIMVTHNSGPS